MTLNLANSKNLTCIKYFSLKYHIVLILFFNSPPSYPNYGSPLSSYNYNNTAPALSTNMIHQPQYDVSADYVDSTTYEPKQGGFLDTDFIGNGKWSHVRVVWTRVRCMWTHVRLMWAHVNSCIKTNISVMWTLDLMCYMNSYVTMWSNFTTYVLMLRTRFCSSHFNAVIQM